MPRQLMTDGEKLFIGEYAEPKLASGQVRIRAEYGAAKHGTEMYGYKGCGESSLAYDKEWGLFLKQEGPASAEPGKPRAVGGNMIVGTVVEAAADVVALRVGDRVASYGGFRQVHTVVAERCRKMPEGLSWKSAVCNDPAIFAYQAIRDGNVRVGDVVAAFGLGAIGLMVVQLAKIAGASFVAAVDPIAERRKIAQKTGADLVLDPAACDPGYEIKKATGRRGADVAIDFSGNVRALQSALRSVAFGGTVAYGAFPPAFPAGLDLGREAHLNRPNLVFSRTESDPNRDHPRWDYKRVSDSCWGLLCSGRLVGEEIVTPVVSLDELPEMYGKIATMPETSVKLGAKLS